MVRRFAHREYYYNDMANNLKINHLDMTFEPTWTKVPGEERNSTNPRSVRDPNPAYAGGVRGVDRLNVLPGMMGGEFGQGQSKRVRWAPSLQLEQFLRQPMPEEFAEPPPPQRAQAAAPQHQDVLRLFAPSPAPSYQSVARMFAPRSARLPEMPAMPAAQAAPPDDGMYPLLSSLASFGGRDDADMDLGPAAFVGGDVDLGPAAFVGGDVDLGPAAFVAGDMDLGQAAPAGDVDLGQAAPAGDVDLGQAASAGDNDSCSGGSDSEAAAPQPKPPPKQGLGSLFASSRGRGGGGAGKKKQPPAPPP
jgi:hypothetical protein